MEYANLEIPNRRVFLKERKYINSLISLSCRIVGHIVLFCGGLCISNVVSGMDRGSLVKIEK